MLQLVGVNCPLCASPLLFGASSCPCGYNHQLASPDDALAIELTYWEALRAYWRTYWPSQLLLGVLLVGLQAIGVAGLLSLAVQIVLGGLALFIFVSRITSQPYRGFSLVVVDVATGDAGRKLTVNARSRVSVFLWWRQILAGMFAALLAGPLNMVLSIMGLQVSQGIAVLAGILVIGPILLKMLIGHEFGEFRIEARRGAQQTAVTSANPLVRRLAGAAILLAAIAGFYAYTRSQSAKNSRLTGAAIVPKGQFVETPTVLFDIKSANQPLAPGVELYECTYEAYGSTARFRLQFQQKGPLQGSIPLAAAEGKFIAVRGSESGPLLQELQKALEATHLPSAIVREKELPFDAVVLGERQSHGGTGGWASNPPGDWKSIKIFLPSGSDDGEMFLGLNPVAGKGEFSIKDPDYGDYLLAKLATVL